jgi:cellobiose phosphorylase
MRNDQAMVELCHNQAKQLQKNIDDNGWDGQWYRRAYFDDGTPLGSAQNVECQIDSISQSWSILSGAGEPKRARIAMDAVDQRLVRRKDAIIQLLAPPFDKSDQNPGYIRGYVPGVRENGGQYTHAAVWSAMAFAKMGDKVRAWELMQIINPIKHGNTAEGIAVYKVEPYVAAADVYAVAPHVGRGGWTWYTGSAGWMYRLVVESLLGLKLEGNKLTITPCLPDDWGSYGLSYRHLDTTYRISVTQANSAEKSAEKREEKRTADHPGMMRVVKVDGVEQIDGVIHLLNDKQKHTVEISVN